MAFYSDDIIQRVRETADIVEIIGEYLPLKRKGRNFWAKCPFHQEKTASFSVSADKQIFYCFGCGKGGNVFSFIMEYEKLPFPESVKYLAQKAGIHLPEQAFVRESKELERLYYAHEVAVDFFVEHLKNSRKTLDYLQGRKLFDEVILKFKLGYAPDSWEALINRAKSKSLTEGDLEQAGLVVRNEQGRFYDRFRDRLTFTIFNTAQKPIAFGARTLKADDEVKYINSPETPLYHKGSILYGLSHSRGEIRRKEEAIVVEGYFDYLSLYQAGIQNVVASSGTAFTTEQAQILSRSTSSVILMFDSDSAGQQAAVRSVDLLFEAGLEVRVVTLPKGDDPDSIARKGGRAAIEEQLSRAQSFVEFSLTMLPDRYDRLSLGVKEKAIKRLTALAGKLEDPVRRELFIQEIARQYRMDAGILSSSVKTESSRPPAPSEHPKTSPLEEYLLAVLLARPDLIPKAASRVAPNDFDDRSLADVYTLMTLFNQEGKPISAAELIDKAESRVLKETIAALAAREHNASEVEKTLSDYLKAFDQRSRERRRKHLKEALQQAKLEGDQDRIDYYLNEIRNLKSEN